VPDVSLHVAVPLTGVRAADRRQLATMLREMRAAVDRGAVEAPAGWVNYLTGAVDALDAAEGRWLPLLRALLGPLA
jgi:hypothetical protein